MSESLDLNKAIFYSLNREVELTGSKAEISFEKSLTDSDIPGDKIVLDNVESVFGGKKLGIFHDEVLYFPAHT